MTTKNRAEYPEMLETFSDVFHGVQEFGEPVNLKEQDPGFETAQNPKRLGWVIAYPTTDGHAVLAVVQKGGVSKPFARVNGKECVEAIDVSETLLEVKLKDLGRAVSAHEKAGKSGEMNHYPTNGQPVAVFR